MGAPLEDTEHGLVCRGDGWFVVNVREMPPRTPTRYGGWLDR